MTPTVVLLHGFTHTGSSWDPVIAALGERYRVLAPDIRGHGASSEVVPVALEGLIDDLAALAPAGRFTLAGYSMGARLALHAALALPDRVGRLVLISGSPGIADAGEREQRRLTDERLADEIERSSIEAFAERWAQTPVLAGLPEDVLGRIQGDRLRNSPAGLARALRGLGTGSLPSVWGRLGELEMPVTLVVGELDQKFRTIADAMAQSIDRCEVIVVPAVGHAVHLETPERVAEIIAGR